jgi:GBP family porin
MKTFPVRTIAPLALAAGLSFASNAHAQNGPGAGVTLYGLMDACMARSDRGADRDTALNSGCLFGSRLGFRGVEDLGGGLRASFVLETGITIDNGEIAQGGRFFGRKALVALAGRWGAVEMGRDYAPAFYLVQPIDPMALGIGTASSTLWTGSASSTAARNNNAVNLLSPSWNGWSLRLQATAGHDAADGSRKARGMNLLYRSGKTVAGVATSRVANANESARDTGTTIGVRHNFGRFTLSAIAQTGAWRGTRTATAASASSIFSRSYRSYLVGGSIPVSSTTTVAGSFKRYDDRTAANFGARQWSVNVVHALSQRTALYAGYSRLTNLRAAAYGISDATTAYTGVTPGSSTSLLATGIKHTF